MTTASFHQDPRAVRKFRHFSRIMGALVCVAGLVALAVWWWGLPRLATGLPDHPPITANAAIGFALSGAALFLNHATGRWRSRVAPLLSLLVLGIGIAALGGQVLAPDSSVDHELGGSAPPAAALLPRLMDDLVAVALVLLGGLGLLVSVRQWLWVREALAIALLMIAMIGLAAHGFALAGRDPSLFSQVPIPMALLLLATLGWLSAAPTTGLTRVATAATLGGVFARRLLVPVLLLPVVFTYAFQLLQSWLSLPEVLASALMAVFSGGAVALLIWWVALLLDKLERQREKAAQWRTDADTDILTGLANRRAFDDALAGMLRGQRGSDGVFSLLMLDLDKFKSYNDDFGHLAGDEVLRITGRLLGGAVRPSDLVARYGGEEFALLLPAADAINAAAVAMRVLEAYRAFAWPNRAVTISIGVAQSAPGDDAAALIERADAALYEAKNSGRDRAATAAGG